MILVVLLSDRRDGSCEYTFIWWEVALVNICGRTFLFYCKPLGDFGVGASQRTSFILASEKSSQAQNQQLVAENDDQGAFSF